MAEIKQQEEPTLSAKRKPELTCDDNPKKTTKLEAPPNNNIDSSVFNEKNDFLESSEHNSSTAQEEDSKFETDLLADAEDNDEDEEDYEEEEEDEEEDDEDGEDSGETEGNRKGKGIVRDDKGKGKLILGGEEEDDDDDGSDISNGESDLSDDPLAEVDLDNILPSRTRKRTIQPGVYIASDLGNNDDDSNGSDARG